MNCLTNAPLTNMINYKNYFLSTKGRFSPLSPKTTQRFWDTVNLRHPEKSKSVFMNGHRFDFVFVSRCARCKSISCYWVSSDDKYLIRLSDHWSDGAKFAVNCEQIGSCYWQLSKHLSKGRFPFYRKVIEGGIIAFEKMERL